MEWFDAIILGLVQGLTEFLPVSSSGHLVLGREVLGIDAPEDLVFETTVHAATVLSTIIVFRSQIWSLLKGLFKFKYNDETDYILKICVSMIPVFIVGMFFRDFVEGLFGSVHGVAAALVVTAVLLAFGRAVGDAASVLYVTGENSKTPTSLLDNATTLPVAIYNQINSPYAATQDKAYASAFVLTLIILLISLLSRYISKRYQKYRIY